MSMRATTQTTNRLTTTLLIGTQLVSLSECGHQHRIFIDWNLPWRTMTETPWSTVLPEKLAGPQLVKKLHSFYATWRFITSFTSIHHLSQIDSVHASPSYFLKIHFNIVLHLRPGLPNGLFVSGHANKTLYAPLLSPTRVTCPAPLILLNMINRIIFGEAYIC